MLRRLPTVAAVVLALAVGIALGAGPLAGKAEDALFASTRTPERTAGDDFGDAVARQVGSRLYAQRLSGRPVAVLALPGAAPEVVKALGEEVVRAGGAPPTVWEAGRTLTSSGDMTLVDTLGSQLLEQLGRTSADPDAPAYERMGQLIGSAIASRKATGEPAGDDVASIRQSLDAAELVSVHTDSTRLAPIVVVVLGDDADDRIVSGLLSGISSRTRGLVVTAVKRRGDLEAAASVSRAATVDGVDRPLGRLAAVLAAIRSLDTPGGSFGASGSDGALPLR